jgi:hypothetical protein
MQLRFAWEMVGGWKWQVEGGECKKGKMKKREMACFLPGFRAYGIQIPPKGFGRGECVNKGFGRGKFLRMLQNVPIILHNPQTPDPV